MELRPFRLATLIILPVALASLQAPGEPRIISAFSDEGTIYFSSPDSIDWAPLLPDSLRAEALNRNPERRQALRESSMDFGGSAEIFFSAKAPPSLGKNFYYLLDSSGIREIRPGDLKGVAGVNLLRGTDSIETVSTYGYVRSQIISNGGFVLVGRQRLSLKQEPSAIRADSLLGTADPYLGTPFRQMVRQYGVRMTAPRTDRWIFVQWLADSAGIEGYCAFRFALFHLAPEPAMVSSNDYGCDV